MITECVPALMRTYSSLLLEVVLLVASIDLWFIHCQRGTVKAFENSELELLRSDLVRKLGESWKPTNCERVFRGAIPSGCTTEEIYASPFSSSGTSILVIQDDGKGGLIDKYHYVPHESTSRYVYGGYPE
jgi:hypothetical protein